MDNIKHSPLPWAVCVEAPNPQWDVGRVVYSVPGGNRVCDMPVLASDATALANAALIVSAVNSHSNMERSLRQATMRAARMEDALKASDPTRAALVAIEAQERAEALVRELVEALRGAGHALRSYQYGNSATDLAEDGANAIDALLARVGGKS